MCEFYAPSTNFIMISKNACSSNFYIVQKDDSFLYLHISFRERNVKESYLLYQRLRLKYPIISLLRQDHVTKGMNIDIFCA